MVEVFGIMSLSGEHLDSENRVEPSYGISRAPLGVVWKDPGKIFAPNGASIRVPFGFLWEVFWGHYLLVRSDLIFEGFLIRSCEHFLVLASFV